MNPWFIFPWIGSPRRKSPVTTWLLLMLRGIVPSEAGGSKTIVTPSLGANPPASPKASSATRKYESASRVICSTKFPFRPKQADARWQNKPGFRFWSLNSYASPPADAPMPTSVVMSFFPEPRCSRNLNSLRHGSPGDRWPVAPSILYTIEARSLVRAQKRELSSMDALT